MHSSYLASHLDQAAGDFRLACISDELNERKSETFDTAHLNRLFEFGHASGSGGSPSDENPPDGVPDWTP